MRREAAKSCAARKGRGLDVAVVVVTLEYRPTRRHRDVSADVVGCAARDDRRHGKTSGGGHKARKGRSFGSSSQVCCVGEQRVCGSHNKCGRLSVLGSHRCMTCKSSLELLVKYSNSQHGLCALCMHTMFSE